MRVAFLEYEFDFHNQIAGGADICVQNMYNLISENHTVEFFMIKDYLTNISALIEILDSFDIVIHNFLKGTFNHDDNILENILVSLKKAITLYIDHDRYPVYNVFYKQKKKAHVTHTCDYILTYNKFLYDNYFNSNRVLNIENYFNYRNISLIKTNKMLNNIYQARISNTKGALLYYNFLEKLNKYNNKYINILIGFSGTPAEIGFKKLPGNILHIWKDKNRIEQNSENTFLHVYPFEKNQNLLVQNLRVSEFAWNAYNLNKKHSENLYTNKGFEGAAIESILCGAIPILNGHQRDLVIENKKLEDYNCCLFLDDNNIDKLADDYIHCDKEKMQNNLSILAAILADKSKYINFFNNLINYCISNGKQSTGIFFLH